jgi:predicted Zn-dependent protease
VPYGLQLAFWVLFLGGITTAFVLVVLPQRYVFQTGLRSSGVSFPANGAPFRSGEVVMVEPAARPGPEGTAGGAAPGIPGVPGHPADGDPDAPPPPGPAELLWERTGPLMAEGREAEALPHFEEYLAAHPGDHAVRMEYAVALARTGRPDEADAAFLRVIEATGDRRARLERAHLLRDRGAWDQAVALYRELARERPGDLAVETELARTLAQARRWDESEAAYRDLLAGAPDRHDLRVELANVLWSAGRPEEADRTAAAVPTGVPERTRAEELRSLLAAAAAEEAPVPEPDPEPTDRLVLAREALEEGDTDRVWELYREDRAESAGDPERILAWADLFQHRLEDYHAARARLGELAELDALSPELRLRLARLATWTGHEAEAVEELERVLAERPDEVEAWTLLGDVRRWWNERPEAAHAYGRALALDPADQAALEGRAALTEATARALADREAPGVGPTLTFFRDSEGYRRLDVVAHGTLLRDEHDVMRVRSGFRRLEGFRLDGTAGREEGFFAEVDLARWWREGTVRASLTGGAERLEPGGVQPLFGAAVRADRLSGWDLEAAFRHERAYALVTTFESADLVVHADQVRVALARRLGPAWSLAGSVEGGALRSDEDTTWRGVAGLGLHRRVAPALRVGATSRVLAYADAAPVPLDRPAFWDPELFWATEVPIELQGDRPRGWNAHLRLSPGVAYLRQRGVDETGWNPQFGGELGARFRGERAHLDANLFHTRGREGDYDALGFSVHLSIRR